MPQAGSEPAAGGDQRAVAAVSAADRLALLPDVPERGSVRVLMIGDVIGKPGRQAVERTLAGLREERRIDLVIANGENLAGGMGLTVNTAAILFESGVDVITSGNHIWDKREIYEELDRDERILRPINYGDHEVPGRGWGVFHAADGSEVAVINAQGRTFMQPIENPFTTIDTLLEGGADELPPVRIVDFHCEITSEKNALGLYLDGRVSAVCGTHTHVATADERILPRFINALPTRFEVGSGDVLLNAILLDLEVATGRARAIGRISRVVEA